MLSDQERYGSIYSGCISEVTDLHPGFALSGLRQGPYSIAAVAVSARDRVTGYRYIGRLQNPKATISNLLRSSQRLPCTQFWSGVLREISEATLLLCVPSKSAVRGKVRYCAQTVTGFPGVRKRLSIGDDFDFLCGWRIVYAESAATTATSTANQANGHNCSFADDHHRGPVQHDLVDHYERHVGHD